MRRLPKPTKKSPIDILEFRYQQARYGDHSICILYEEDSNYD